MLHPSAAPPAPPAPLLELLELDIDPDVEEEDEADDEPAGSPPWPPEPVEDVEEDVSPASHAATTSAVRRDRLEKRRVCKGFGLTGAEGDPMPRMFNQVIIEMLCSKSARTKRMFGANRRRRAGSVVFFRSRRRNRGMRRVEQLMKAPSRNVLGGPLAVCSQRPVTGFFRNGCCDTGTEDVGSHTVCAVMTADFLAFSKSRGNDLSTPMPQFGFPGLKPGDRWCLCARRWQEAQDAGKAPLVVLTATHERALEVCDLNALKRHAIDMN